MAIEAYCVKCKAKKEMQNPVEGVTKNGKPIMKGTCPDCGGKRRTSAIRSAVARAAALALLNNLNALSLREAMFHVKHRLF